MQHAPNVLKASTQSRQSVAHVHSVRKNIIKIKNMEIKKTWRKRREGSVERETKTKTGKLENGKLENGKQKHRTPEGQDPRKDPHPRAGVRLFFAQNIGRWKRPKLEIGKSILIFI